MVVYVGGGWYMIVVDNGEAVMLTISGKNGWNSNEIHVILVKTFE